MLLPHARTTAPTVRSCIKAREETRHVLEKFSQCLIGDKWAWFRYRVWHETDEMKNKRLKAARRCVALGIVLNVARAAAKRKAVALLQTVMGALERRVRRIVAADSQTARYSANRPPDPQLGAKPRGGLSNECRRFRYRRLSLLLRQEGHRACKKRICRLWRDERVTVRKRCGPRPAIGAGAMRSTTGDRPSNSDQLRRHVCRNNFSFSREWRFAQ